MMTNDWHVGKFNDVLESVSRAVHVEPDKVYRNLGVQWYAKGLFVREEKPGYDIKAKELYQVQVGDLVYNRLFAWKGSFAVAEEDTAGGFVSGEFPCFRVDTSKADPKFLHLYLSQEKIWQEIERISTGQTNISRLRLKEPVFLDMEVPLPPLTEQRRIVARIEALAGRIAEMQSMREAIEDDVQRMLLSAFQEITGGVNHVPMGSIAPIVRRPVIINGASDYPELGIRSFGKGTFHKPALSGAEVGTKRLFKIKSGDLMFSNVFAWEGAIAVATPEDDGRFGSHRFISCVPKDGKALDIIGNSKIVA